MCFAVDRAVIDANSSSVTFEVSNVLVVVDVSPVLEPDAGPTGEDEWQIIVNRSTSQWGRENRYTPEVEAQEVGRGTVSSGQTDGPVETFTIRAESSASGATVFLEWENTRVPVPLVATDS